MPSGQILASQHFSKSAFQQVSLSADEGSHEHFFGVEPRAPCSADGPPGIMLPMNAYSEDLRKKIVQALRRGTTKSEVARSFSVSRSSVKRYAKLVQEGRPLAPKRRPGSRPK